MKLKMNIRKDKSRIKNMSKSVNLIVILVIIIITFFIIMLFKNNSDMNVFFSNKFNVEYSKNVPAEWMEYRAKITLNDDKTKIEGEGVSNTGSAIKIQESGKYYFTGEISDATIIVDTKEDNHVDLVFGNCSIESKKSSPIIGLNCKNLTIFLEENTENTLTDSSEYKYLINKKKQKPDGCIYSNNDLTIAGTGKLIVKSNNEDGIVSEKNLKITNCELDISSADDGIRSKNIMYIRNANIKTNSNGKGIKTTDEVNGSIQIDKSTIDLNVTDDGIQSASTLNIYGDSKINIIAKNKEQDGKNEENKNDKEIICKGIKANADIIVESGTIIVDASDDAIHSNGIILINDGEFKLKAKDDGIHADKKLVINNGKIVVLESYEGIESSYIQINGGDINVTSTDDGISVGGEEIKENKIISGIYDIYNILEINGGNIKIYSDSDKDGTGDGIDSNAEININGGSIYVLGPTNDEYDEALDISIRCAITGGDMILCGASDTWKKVSQDTNVVSLTFLNINGKKNDELILRSSSGKIIRKITLEDDYDQITFSNQDIELNEKYALYKDEQKICELRADSFANSNIKNQNEN